MLALRLTSLSLVCYFSVVVISGQDTLPELSPDGGPYHEDIDVTSDWDPYGAPDKSTKDATKCQKDNNKGPLKEHPDIHLRVPQIIVKYGYDFEEHKVTTDDGYILGVMRIKGSPISPWKEGKRPVYLNHGLLGNAMSWLFLYENNSLAFKLANAGYDVFLGNQRGNSYSQGHTSLKTDSDKYWDFDWHEAGLLDLPAVIDHILKVTGQPKTYYVGHSMGTTQYMVCMSLKPEYGRKIAVGFMLAPVGGLGTAYNPVGRAVLSAAPPFKEFWHAAYGNYLAAQKSAELDSMCPNATDNCGVCTSSIYGKFGYNPQEMNQTVAPFLTARYMDTGSTYLLSHYAQNMIYNSFRPYLYPDAFRNIQAYGSNTPPDYPLEHIIAPTVAYWGSGDNMAESTSTKKTLKKFALGIIKENNRVPQAAFGHMDFLSAIHIQKFCYNRIQWIMDQKRYVDP